MGLASFIQLKPTEKIAVLVRPFAGRLIPATIMWVIMLALPAGVYVALAAFAANALANQNALPLLALLAGLYYLFVNLSFYTYFVNYFLDLLIVTTERLVTIEQQGLFSRSISELDLTKIEDITSEVKGIFPTLFRYGHLLIETAGAVDKFNLENIPRPEKLRETILGLAEDRRKQNPTPAQ